MASQSKRHKTKRFHMWFRSGKELKNTNKCRGLHFYNSCNRRINKLIIQEELNDSEYIERG